jgi:hypothetical protein
MFYLPSTVNLHYFKVNSIGQNSNLSTGSNVIINRNVSNHRNEGFGEENSDGTEYHIPISYVDDSDVLDSVALKHTK